jgi:hypothetical protein
MDRIAFTPNELASAFRTLRLHCHECRHSAPMDLRARIAAGLGDRPMLNFRGTSCGCRNVGIIIGMVNDWVRQMDASRERR